MRDETIIRALDPSHFQLIILPTEQCNFRCSYCYEDFEIGRMKPSVVAGLKRLLLSRSQSLRTLQLSWFGGEPLLALPVIRDVLSYAAGLAGENSFSMNSSMTTNAYLLNSDTLTELTNLGVTEYQITLDGPRETHDRTRLRADGAGTFDVIFKNIMDAHRSPHSFRATLRVHYSESTAVEVTSLLLELSQLCEADERFTVHLKSIENLGGPKGASVPNWSAGARERLHSSLSSLLPSGRVVQFDEYLCYAAKANSIVIRADGSLAKCTVAFHDPTNRIGHITEEGTIEVNSDKLSFWLRGLSTGNDGELACPAGGRFKSIPIRSIQ